MADAASPVPDLRLNKRVKRYVRVLRKTTTAAPPAAIAPPIRLPELASRYAIVRTRAP